jgi:hypothetical protein
MGPTHSSLTGISLKAQHYEEILAAPPDIGWFEVHPENYMGAGGPAHRYLALIRDRHDISLHGVGLSIGGAEALDRDHLARLRSLVDRYQPVRFSEHLAWSSHGGTFFNDLLPLPYNAETLEIVCRHVAQTQEALARPILIENPATYVTFADDEMAETEFLAAIARQTGCGLLLDVNNVMVSCTNRGDDPLGWIDSLPAGLVGQIHLAGHDRAEIEGAPPLLIDSHDRAVDLDVWYLFEHAVRRFGPVPTLIERDADIPPLGDLLAEAAMAADILACNHAPQTDGELRHVVG